MKLYMRTSFSIMLLVSILWQIFLISPAPAGAMSEAFDLSTAVSPWKDVQQKNGIIYFLSQSTPAIKRYHLESEAWLTDLTFPETPTAFTIGQNNLYAAFGLRISKFSLEGDNEAHLINTPYTVVSLHIVDQMLIVNYGGRYLSVNLTTGKEISRKEDMWYALTGVSVAPTIGKLFGRTSGISPSDIVSVTFTPQGTFTSYKDSPYHGDYASGSKTWVFPGENMVIDSAGIIYNTADLTYRGSLVGTVDDIAFYGDQLIVLRNGALIMFSNKFMETARYTSTNAPAQIYLFGDTVYAFYLNAQGAQVEKISISQFTPPASSPYVEPRSLAYTPDMTVMGKDNTVFLLSKKYQSIFRWSITQRRYLETIPLLNTYTPYAIAYSEVDNNIYVAYSTGMITRISLNQSIKEEPIANLPASPCGLATAGKFIFACDASGAWVAHSTFTAEGVRVSYKDWNYYSSEYIWNETRRKMYFFRDDTSPNDIIWEDIDANGAIGSQKDSPYHDSAGISHPIRVKPDGSIVLLGSGRIYDGLSLSLLNNLPNSISDGTWKNNTLYTLRLFNNGSQVQKWTESSYGIDKTLQLEGLPLRSFSIPEGLLVITNVSGVPNFYIVKDDLSEAVRNVQANFSASPLVGDVPLPVQFSNLSTQGPYTSSEWNFGDSTTSTGNNPVHNYVKSGSYPVTLTVTGPNGSDTISKVITVEVRPVKANFSVSKTLGFGPTNIQFANTSTGWYDTIVWDFGDGTTSDVKNPTHLYSKAGFYTVKLTVSGQYGSDTLTKTNLIEIRPSQPSFTATPRAGNIPLVVQFANTTTGAIDSVLWNFGDGSTSSELNPSHTYTSTGTFNVSLAVTQMGITTTETKTGFITVYPVKANFGVNVTTGSVPLSVTFTNTTTGEYETAAWDFGDGSTSTEKNPVHEYTVPGTYSVTLTVNGTYGSDTIMKKDLIVVYPVKADFAATTKIGDVPLTVQFTNTSLGGYTTVEWDFGDDTTSTDRNPLHTYDKPGKYTVTLKINGPYGSDLVTKSDFIEVRPVKANFMSSATVGKMPLIVQFTNTSTGSYDSALWDFGDGTTSKDINPSHTYAQAGIYTVTLQVSGVYGSDKMIKSEYIRVGQIVADFSTSIKTGEVPLVVHFVNTSIGEYTDVVWNFGDGTTSSETNPVHTYTKPGSYSVTLAVSSPNSYDFVNKYNLIEVQPVKASFTASVTNGKAPLTVQFTNTSKESYNTVLWNFGDGSTSSEKNPSHTYTNSGSHTVTLMVSGPYGSDTLVKSDLIVTGSATANFAASAFSGPVPLTVQFTNASTGTYHTFAWDFGDGSTSTEGSPKHTYTTPGIYTVQLTIDGPYGNSTIIKSNLIEVKPISANFTTSIMNGTAPLEVQFTNQSLGEYTAVMWEFGDGSTSTEPNPKHTYTQPGQYTARLTIDGPYGTDTIIKTNLISVGSTSAPDFTVPTTVGSAPLQIAFTMNEQEGVVSVFWDFGDGSTSTERNPVHSYTTPGVYTVQLTINRSSGSETIVKTNLIRVEGKLNSGHRLFVPAIYAAQP